MFDMTTTTATTINLSAGTDEALTQREIVDTPSPFDNGVYDAFFCVDCGLITEEPSGPLYECNGCGTLFNRDSSRDGCSHRCPDCGRFGGRIADHSCPDCNSAEAESIEATLCPECCELINVSFWEEHWADCHTTDQEEQA